MTELTTVTTSWLNKQKEILVTLFQEKNRLQAEVDANKVYCTGDGDYPEKNHNVIFEDDDGIWIGGFNEETRTWFSQDDEVNSGEPTDYPVFWKYLISPKSAYIARKGAE